MSYARSRTKNLAIAVNCQLNYDIGPGFKSFHYFSHVTVGVCNGFRYIPSGRPLLVNSPTVTTIPDSTFIYVLQLRRGVSLGRAIMPK